MRNRIKTAALSIICALGMSVMAIADDAPKQTVFTNVNVYDGVTPKLVEGASVLVEGNLIKAVSTETIDARGAKELLNRAVSITGDRDVR